MCKRYQKGFVFALFSSLFPLSRPQSNRSIQFASSSKQNLFHLDCTDLLIWSLIRTINDMSFSFPPRTNEGCTLPASLSRFRSVEIILRLDSWQVRSKSGDTSYKQVNRQQGATAERGRGTDAKAGKREYKQAPQPTKHHALSLLSKLNR